MSGGLNTGVATASFQERGNDLYETPAVATHALLKAETLPRNIWEPACGNGAIIRVLRDAGYNVISTDIMGGTDFLVTTSAPAPAIVTNPPYKLAQQFVAHALSLCPYVAMLLRLAFLESERRRPILDNAHLARVHVFRNRLPMMHRDGWEGPRISNGAIAFAWFVWDKSHSGPTILNRISWE